MRWLVVLMTVALVGACSDGNPLVPDDTAEIRGDQPPVVAALDPGQNEKWAFEAEVVFVEPIDPGENRLTPSGVWLGKGLINKFEMTGDLTGFWYFIGDAQANLKNGMGRSIGHLIIVEITASDLGTGIFECRTSARIENYPNFETFIQYGNITGCHGTEDFAGMRMKAYVTNEASPGLGLGATYDLWGEIW